MKYEVYYDLEETRFTFNTIDFTYYFSTKKRLERFKERMLDNRKKVKIKFESQYGISVKLSNFADFYLYKNVECKGFRVLCNHTKGVITCLNNLILDGQIKTSKNSNEQ